MGDFKSFYNRIGLVEYPFATFTTENETVKFQKLFVRPNDYDSVVENFNQTNSIILTGDRGTGKTAIIKDIITNTHKSNFLVANIYDYTDLKVGYELRDLYSFLISRFSAALFNSMADYPKSFKELSKDEKLLLSYLLKNFLPQLSKGSLREKISRIQKSWFQRNWTLVKQLFRSFGNYGATAAGTFIDEYLAKHFKGLPPISDTVRIKDFFPELPVNIETEFIDQESSYQLLQRIIKIARKLGFDRQVIIFDKVDEDQRFSNDAEEISKFVVKLLTDNKLLLDETLQLVISLWVTPFNFIKDEVRTQKHYCPNLTWSEEELKMALNRRLLAFSDGTISDFRKLFDEAVAQEQIQEIFAISNSNPRDLWHAFNHLLRTQYNLDPVSSKIGREAIPKALRDFVTSFNYYEYYPRKSNARANSMDIYSYSKYLLKLESELFTKNQLNDKAGTGGSTNNYVIGMERIGLIAVDSQESGTVIYKIRDPKLTYALKNKLEIRRD